METRVTFEARNVTIEGLLYEGDAKRAAIILHPHPVYGGNMNNHVVQTIALVYQQKGLTTLRFNFRGAGGSGGDYDHGIAERTDIEGAIGYLQSQGIEQLDLVGYSFGAWVLAGWTQDNPRHGFRIMLVAPPVAFLDFSDIRAISGLHAVIVGKSDEFAPVGRVQSQLTQWCDAVKLSVLSTADHFFNSGIDELEQAILEHLD
ncbi:MAG: alpha/beta hydrolase [Desulfobacteraceae bacterium]|jgi:alpha/beta superfamily hydrolase